MYSPATGTFLTRDSWQGYYTESLTLNRWLYAMGNPTAFTDSSGREPEPYVCDWSKFINWDCKLLNNPNTNARYLKGFYQDLSVISRAKKNFGYAADLMVHFLENSGDEYRMPTNFIKNVLLKDENESRYIEDDLKQFLIDVVKPLAITLPECSNNSITFVSSRSFPVPSVTSEALFYAWNVHDVNVEYEGRVFRDVSDPYNGYKVVAHRDFHAYDRYDWHGIGDGNKTANFDTPFGRVTVPDEWAARVRNAGLAAEFDMYADWSVWAVYWIEYGVLWDSPTKIMDWTMIPSQ